jgi:beta-lactamase class A
VGVGLGVIAGSLLTALDPASHTSVAASEAKPDATDPSSQSVSTHPTTTAKPLTAQRTALQVTTEMQPLKQDVQALIAQQTDLVPGIFILDLDTGSYLDINGKQVFPTASMIKVPILVAFFQDVDAGKIRLDEQLTMRADLIASESGNMQYLPVGSKFTALETASEMIRISDNTATNMIIDRLGGVNVLNQRFQSWGLTDTKISNVLPDLEGTNISSPRDFVKLLALVSQGDLISLRSRDRCLSILRTPVTDTLLPKGLGEGATIAHKTGDIGSLVGDVGLIDMPSGKRYLAAVMVKRPYNDSRAQELIRQISRATYQYLQSSVHQSERNSPGVLPVNNVAIDATPPQPTSMSLQD